MGTCSECKGRRSYKINETRCCFKSPIRESHLSTESVLYLDYECPSMEVLMKPGNLFRKYMICIVLTQSLKYPITITNKRFYFKQKNSYSWQDHEIRCGISNAFAFFRSSAVVHDIHRWKLGKDSDLLGRSYLNLAFLYLIKRYPIFHVHLWW